MSLKEGREPLRQAAECPRYDDTIRVSVGIEDREDLIADFKEAIRKSKNG